MILAWILGVLSIPIIFWLMFLMECWWLIAATERESFFGALTAILCGGTLFIIEFGSFSGAFYAVKDNPILVLAAFCIYLAAGTVWAFFKWYLFIRDRADTIKHHIWELGRDKAIERLSYYKDGERNNQEIIDTNFACLAPNVKDHKSSVLTWITLWVPSAIWFVVNDPIRRAANWIYDQIKGAFQGISDRMFKSAFRID